MHRHTLCEYHPRSIGFCVRGVRYFGFFGALNISTFFLASDLRAMADLLDIEGDIDKALRGLRTSVDSLSGIAEAAERKSAISDARRQRGEVHRLIGTLRAAVRASTNRTDKALYDKKRIEFDEELKSLTERISEAAAPPASANRRRRGQPPAPEEVDGNNLQTTQEVFSEIHNVQDKTYALAQKTLRVGHNAEQISQGTLMTLQKQNELIMQADDTLDGLDSNLKKASRQVSAIARGMAADKCFLCLFVILVLALGVLIFWKIYDGRGKKDTPATQPTLTTTALPTPPPVTLLRGLLKSL